MTSMLVADPEAPDDLMHLHHDLLVDDLDLLDAAARQLPQLSDAAIHERVDAALSYLHDDVLRHAHAEEVALFPLMERTDHATMGVSSTPFHAEHDTVRDATGQLGRLAVRKLTPAAVADLAGLLDGIHLMLAGHFARESEMYVPMLAELDPDQRRRLLSHLADLGETRGVEWLPDWLPAEGTRGYADLLEPEGLVGASCDPHVLAVVRSAIAANVAGVDAQQWRLAVAGNSRYRRYLDHAQECMSASGLWPWTSAVTTETVRSA